MNVSGPLWWEVNIGSGNGLVPSGKEPLPEPHTTSHYLSQCWPRSMSPNGVTRPPLVNSLSPWWCGYDFKCVNFQHNLIDTLSSQANITLEWIPEDLLDKPTLPWSDKNSRGSPWQVNITLEWIPEDLLDKPTLRWSEYQRISLTSQHYPGVNTRGSPWQANITLEWIPEDLLDKSTLPWSEYQRISLTSQHYPGVNTRGSPWQVSISYPCWPRPLMPCGVTRPQWVKSTGPKQWSPEKK